MTNTPSNLLRTHRKNSGLTQRELARVLGYRHAGPVLRSRQRVVEGTESRLHGDLIWESATVFNPQVVRKGRQFPDRLLVVATETQDRECGRVIIGSH